MMQIPLTIVEKRRKLGNSILHDSAKSLVSAQIKLEKRVRVE